MTAKPAPFNAYMVTAIVKRPDGMQAVAFLSEGPTSEDEAKIWALGSWREQLPDGCEYHTIQAQGVHWRRMTEGEISRCVS